MKGENAIWQGIAMIWFSQSDAVADVFLFFLVIRQDFFRFEK